MTTQFLNRRPDQPGTWRMVTLRGGRVVEDEIIRIASVSDLERFRDCLPVGPCEPRSWRFQGPLGEVEA